jgi:hypothetical protein
MPQACLCCELPSLLSNSSLRWPCLPCLQVKVINADNGVNIGGGDFLTVQGTRFEQTKSR